MLQQLLILQYAGQNEFSVKLKDRGAVGVEVDAYMPDLRLIFVVIDRSAKHLKNTQSIIEHFCKRNGLKCVLVDTRKGKTAVCDVIKSTLRTENIFIRFESDRDIEAVMTQFTKWRLRNA